MAKVKNNKKKQTNMDKGVSIALAVFAIIIVAVLVTSACTSSGVFIRAEAAMSTENVKVDSAMMNFFYNNYLSNWYNNYSAYLQAGYFSLNPSQSLKTQTYGSGYEIYFLGSYDGTWYDYFLDAVSAEVETYIIYAEGAIAAGLKLTDEDIAAIDEIMADIKASLKESGAKFSDWYGAGVNANDVRRAYELVYIAENFFEYKQEQLEAALDADDSALKQYVEDNKASFYTADVLEYTITTNSKDFENDEAYDLAKALAVKAAEAIAAAKTADEFVELIKAYEAKEESTVTVDSLKTSITYTESGEVGAWLFTDKAGVNATKVVEAETVKEETVAGTTLEDGTKTEDTKISYDQHNATAYIVVEAMHVDTDLTKDAGYFIADDKVIVEAFLETIKGTEMTAEDFQKAAEDFYNELHEGHDHEDENATEPVVMFEGVESLADGYFPSPYNVLGEWIDADGRENNTYSEITEIKVDDKTTYYGFTYFIEYGDETWYVNAYSATVNKQFEDWATNQAENVTPVTVNNKALSGSITPLAWAVSSTDSHEGHDHD